MNYVLFGVIGLFMFAITGIGFAEVKMQVASRGASDGALEDGVKAGEGEVMPQGTIAGASVQVDSVATSVPEVLVQVAKKVETALFGDVDNSSGREDEEDEDEGEDEDDEEEDDDSRRTTATRTAAQPASQPAAQPATTVSTGGSATFTMAQVAQHGTAASCYSAINGSVYDLTPFVTKHPGGQAAIKSLCGVDGTAAFNGQHGGQASPASVLAQYKIGVLK